MAVGFGACSVDAVASPTRKGELPVIPVDARAAEVRAIKESWSGLDGMSDSEHFNDCSRVA
jgi:hypothetical protein